MGRMALALSDQLCRKGVELDADAVFSPPVKTPNAPPRWLAMVKV